MDNIYSHRSTQKYKRKPFVSHYWDCRLKGRPPGTAKSDDPSKKKRKRQARERDLCDVKIKITEYFPGARAAMGNEAGTSVDASSNDHMFAPEQSDGTILNQQQGQVFGSPFPGDGGFRTGPPGADGGRYYTIQRVSGTGGNENADGMSGGHRHSLEESDRIKKNTVQRHFLKEEKVKRKFQVSIYSSFLYPRFPLRIGIL